MNQNTKTDTEYRFDSFDLILFIKKYFWYLLGISVFAAIVSSIVALSIQEKFRSSVIMFPTTSGSISKSLIATNYGGREDVLDFGEEEEAEQMLQVLHSDEIKSRIIAKFNLMEHYGIEPDAKYGRTALGKIYDGNVKIKRTEYMSVFVSVLDHSADTAALMANTIAELLDTVMNRMQKERAKKALRIVENEYFYLQDQIKGLEDSLTKIRKLGVNDYESQSEVFNSAYAQALAQGASQGRILKLEEKLKVLSEYGGAYVSLSEFLEFQKEQLSDMKAKYAEAKVDAEQSLPHKFIVNNAYAAERKAYPIRWLIVVISTISTAVFSLLILIVWDTVKDKLRS